MQLAVVLLILRTVGKENVNPDLKYFQLPKKKVKISCKSGAQFKCSTSNEEMAMLSKGFVSANTQKNNVRGMQVFLEWRAQRNRAISVKVQQCPENLLDNPDCQKLNFWLSWFVAEVRTTLPSRNIHQILSALQRKRWTDAFLDQKRQHSSIAHAIVCIESSTLRELVQRNWFGFCCFFGLPYCHVQK